MRLGVSALVAGSWLVVGSQAFLPAPTCNSRAGSRVAPRMSSVDSIGKQIRDGLLANFPPKDIPRVLDSWDRMVHDKPFVDEAAKRYAMSYVDGLSAKPWHEVSE